MKIGIAADHGGFVMKEELIESLREWGFDIVDFGAYQLRPDDDYPDFIIPLARAVAAGEVERGAALCGSGIGASIAANKIAGVRAGLVHDVFSARQGVEDDDMNVFCLGGKVIGSALALELIRIFLAARFSNAARHRRRLAKVHALENDETEPRLAPFLPEIGTGTQGAIAHSGQTDRNAPVVPVFKESYQSRTHTLDIELERLLLAGPPL